MGRIRLASLKLTGFKSFADPVELVFPSDVTTIVGPNGVGKSNLVDAMLWVLGEQSPSLLRLKTMGDVVFAGANGRKPAGAAEVSLTLASEDGRWEATDGRLTIGRRVYRSGSSEYRLNGRAVRLKDVLDELLRIGLGTRAYSIIGQDRVGRVLSARPTDRRALLEEAAGITHYRAKRHDAELKLAQTRQNLQRLDDVIAEVDRSLRQIRRQARHAERYNTLESELKLKIKALFGLRAKAAAAERENLFRTRARVENEAAAAASALGGSEADLAAARQRLEQTHAEVEEARSEVATLLTSRERLETFLERSADLLDNLRTSLGTARNQASTLAAARRTAAGKTEAAASRLASLQSALEEVEGKRDAAALAADSARTSFDEAERAASEERQTLLRTISTLTSTRNALRDLERQQDRLTYALSQVDQESERLRARHAASREGLEHARAEAAAAAEEAGRYRSERDALASEREKMASAADEAGRAAEALGHQAWEIKHRLSGIERELARHGAALEQIALLLPESSLAGQVSDYLHPGPDAAPLLDRAWREHLELPVVRLDALPPAAREAAASMEARIRIALVSAEDAEIEAEPIPGATPLMPLAAIDPENRGWLSRVLPAAYRCEDADTARDLAAAHPDAVFATVDGALYRGRTLELETAGSRLRGALELRGERKTLSADFADLTARAEEHRQKQAELRQRTDKIEGDLGELNGLLVNAEQARARTAAIEQSLGEELARLERELEAVTAEAERSRTEATTLQEKRRRLAAEVEELERRSAEIEAAVDRASAVVEARRDEVGRTVRELDRWRAEQRLAAERVDAARADVERLEKERESIEAEIERLTREVGELESKLAQTEDEVVRSRTRLAEEQGLLAGAREQERRLAEAVEEAGIRVAKLEKEVAVRRATHDEVRSRLHELEVEETRVEAEWERLCEGAAGELGTTPEALLEEPLPEDASADGLQNAVEELRRKLERIGPVNLLAVQEVGDLGERSKFLHEQRQDLVRSLKSLDGTIREIDVTCTERFIDTFEKVNGVFAETFCHLFGGGTARLDLADEEDPLESGILITAQPPGKKNQSVQLLSGGEKALTALALLISLFRIKPSPVCILDEVDAALDAANITRLVELVHAMTDHTQFVLITHNRRTMIAADVLYGVTMEKAGVSKVVSVNMEA